MEWKGIGTVTLLSGQNVNLSLQATKGYVGDGGTAPLFKIEITVPSTTLALM
jgi:hypothetical protein